jgi:hypothetical protein
VREKESGRGAVARPVGARRRRHASRRRDVGPDDRSAEHLVGASASDRAPYAVRDERRVGRGIPAQGAQARRQFGREDQPAEAPARRPPWIPTIHSQELADNLATGMAVFGASRQAGGHPGVGDPPAQGGGGRFRTALGHRPPRACHQPSYGVRFRRGRAPAERGCLVLVDPREGHRYRVTVCPRCSGSWPEKARFCPSCGLEMPEASTSNKPTADGSTSNQPGAGQGQSAESQPVRLPATVKWAIGLLLVQAGVGVLIVIVGAWTLLSQAAANGVSGMDSATWALILVAGLLLTLVCASPALGLARRRRWARRVAIGVEVAVIVLGLATGGTASILAIAVIVLLMQRSARAALV